MISGTPTLKEFVSVTNWTSQAWWCVLHKGKVLIGSRRRKMFFPTGGMREGFTETLTFVLGLEEDNRDEESQQ